VGGPAGDLISSITNAMHTKTGLSKLGESVYPYPTYSEALRHMADEYTKSKVTPGIRSMVRRFLRFRR